MTQPTKDRGFTLVEVLIALIMVSVLVTGAVAALQSAASAVRSARVSTSATLLAAQKVEELRAMFTPPSAAAGQDYFTADSVATSAGAAFFVRRWTVTPGWSAAGTSLVEVEVRAAGAGRVVELFAVAGWP